LPLGPVAMVAFGNQLLGWCGRSQLEGSIQQNKSSHQLGAPLMLHSGEEFQS
jgi:hypothetical protein